MHLISYDQSSMVQITILCNLSILLVCRVVLGKIMNGASK